MTLRPAELKAQTRVTRMFIEADARDVILLRRTRTDDGAGGIEVGDPVEQFPQRMRLLPQEDGATERTTSEGESATPQYMLMGLPDANMQRYDEFVLDGVRYEIVYVDDRKYELKGEVIRLGDGV